MSKFNTVYSSFARGQVSQKFLGNVKAGEEFKEACKKLQNWLPLKGGGITRLPGSRVVDRFRNDTGSPVDVIYDMGPVGLVPFILTKKRGFALAFHIGGADSSSPGSLQIVANDSDGSAIPVVETPYNTIYADPNIANEPPNGFRYAQVANFLFVTHISGLMPPLVVIYDDSGSPQFSVQPYGPDFVYSTLNLIVPAPALMYPYYAPNVSSLTLTPSATSGAITLTASAAFFNAGHEGAYFKISHSGVTGVAKVTSYTSTTVVDATVLLNFGATTASTNWEESSWSDYRGWPRTVSYFENRLLWGGNASRPDNIWGSRVNNVFHMMERRFEQDSASDVTGYNYFGDVAETDPFQFYPASKEVNSISWMAALRQLNLGTLGTEYIGSGGDQILSNQSANFRPQTSYGSSPIQPVEVNNEVIFVDRSGRSLRNFRYNDSNGSNISSDLNVIADDISRFGGNNWGFTQLAFQVSRNTVWAINANNRLVGFSYDPTTNKAAWHTHSLGDDTDVLSLCVIPNNDGDFDELMVLVVRDSNPDIYTLEKIGADFDAESLTNAYALQEDIPVYLQGSSIENIVAPGISTIEDLEHHEGSTVMVTKNGIYFGEFEVTNGEIDLGSEQLGRFVVGLDVPSDVVTTPLEAGGDFGSAFGALQRVDRVVARVYKAKGLSMGSEDKVYPLKEVAAVDSDELYTGDSRVEIAINPTTSQSIRALASGPYPCSILALAFRGVTYD